MPPCAWKQQVPGEGLSVKSMYRVPALSVAASVMAIMAATSAANAAEPATSTVVTADSNQLEEIVVTAQFRSQNLQDTPIAITAVNAAMLEARGQTNITQIAAQAPNVSLRPQPQNGGTGLIAYIRGVGQTDFNYAVDPGVGIYVDDVYIPTLSSSLLELMDLDRVEILRGPQGTLAGKNSIGGSIKLFSAKPQGDDSGSFKLSYGSFNEVDVRGMADLKLTDTLSLRISGMSHSTDGYVGILDYGQTHPTSNVPAEQHVAVTGMPITRRWADRATLQAVRLCAGRPLTSSRSMFRPTTPVKTTMSSRMS